MFLENLFDVLLVEITIIQIASQIAGKGFIHEFR